MEKEKPPQAIMPIADHVEFESKNGVIRVTFYTSRLDKDLLPHHIMKLSEITIDKDTAKKVADMLNKHANRGNIEANIKKSPLPKELLPKKKN